MIVEKCTLSRDICGKTLGVLDRAYISSTRESNHDRLRQHKRIKGKRSGTYQEERGERKDELVKYG